MYEKDLAQQLTMKIDTNDSELLDMDESDFVQQIIVIADTHNCKLANIDFDHKVIRVSGSHYDKIGCSVEMENFVSKHNTCGDTYIIDGNAHRFNDNVAWVLQNRNTLNYGGVICIY